MSRLLKTLQKTAKGLRRAGVMDKQTMQQLDILCSPPAKKRTSKEIKQISSTKRTGNFNIDFRRGEEHSLRRGEERCDEPVFSVHAGEPP